MRTGQHTGPNERKGWKYPMTWRKTNDSQPSASETTQMRSVRHESIVEREVAETLQRRRLESACRPQGFDRKDRAHERVTASPQLF